MQIKTSVLKKLAIMLVVAGSLKAQSAPASLVVSGPLLDYGFRTLLLPLQINLAHGVTSTIELKYCSAGDGQARLIAIDVPGNVAVDPSPHAKRFADCEKSIAQIASTAANQPNSPSWVAVLSILPKMAGWNLIFPVTDVSIAGAGSSSPLAEDVASLKNSANPLQQFALDDVRIDIGGKSPLEYAVNGSFLAEAVSVNLIPVSESNNWLQTPHPFASFPADTPNYTNGVVFLSQQHINSVLAQQFTGTQVPFTAGPLNATFLIYNMSVQVAPSSLSVNAMIYQQQQPTMRYSLATLFNGADLAVNHVAVSISNPCGNRPTNPLDIPRWEACEAQYNVAHALAPTASDALTRRYAGTKLRPLQASRKIPIDISGKKASVSAIILQSSASAQQLTVYLDIVLEGI